MNETLQKQIERSILDISARQKRNFSHEGIVLQYLCISPRDSVHVITEQICKDHPEITENWSVPENIVRRVLNSTRMGRREQRGALATAAWAAGQVLADLLLGRGGTLAQYRAQATKEEHLQVPRMILLSLFARKDLPFSEQVYNAVLRLNKDFAAECLDAITELLENAQNTGKAQVESETQRLRKSLLRSQELIQKLQADFDDRLESSKAEEQEHFFSLLNDSRYGYILDMLVSAQRGFDRLRQRGGVVPLEIKSMQNLVRRLLEFVHEFGVVPMTEVGVRKEVGVADLLELQYEGSPFTNDTERKKVEVISPGWKIEDRDIVISFPRVREIIGE